MTYLGNKLSLKEGSDPTLEFRLAEAAAKTSSLRKSIRSARDSLDLTVFECGKHAWSVVPCMDC